MPVPIARIGIVARPVVIVVPVGIVAAITVGAAAVISAPAGIDIKSEAAEAVMVVTVPPAHLLYLAC